MAMNLPTILTGAAVTAAVGTAAYMMTGKKKNTAKQLKKKRARRCRQSATSSKEFPTLWVKTG